MLQGREGHGLVRRALLLRPLAHGTFACPWHGDMWVFSRCQPCVPLLSPSPVSAAPAPVHFMTCPSSALGVKSSSSSEAWLSRSVKPVEKMLSEDI